MELLQQLRTELGRAYSVERELGGGGMARVFVARDRALGRQVVIKVLSPELAAGVSARRFEREIRLAASLQQANIVPVLSAGSAGDVPYYTMPFVEGLSLRQRLSPVERLPLPEAVGILRDVARALAYAHERGVVHRDIKPENVLLSGGTAMVTDFGIAKAISAARGEQSGPDASGATTTVTREGTALGTPAYMSPEQITADPQIDHRADLYSFGCLAYELLAGQAPFAGRSAPRLLVAHLSEQPAALEELCPTCPPDIARMVEQCLAKEPADRPPSAQHILQTLSTAPVAPAARQWPFTRLPRRRRAWAVTLGLVTLGVAAVVLSVTLERGGRGAAGDVSLAILPFANIGGDSVRDIWADGLTDEVTTVLAREGVRLATRTSVERYHGQRNIDVRQAGRALQVKYVLHGTLWPVGQRLRVQVWLSRSADGRDVWQDSYERDAGDILAALDSISGGIRRAVERRVPGATRPLLATSPGALRGTSDTAAYDLYLHGQVLVRARGNAVPRATRLFEQAIARDPDFARAYAALSAALEILPNFTDTTMQEVSGPATAAAHRALELDPTLSQPHSALALALMHAYRWAEADSEFQQALSLDPNDAYTRMHYGRFFVYTGRLADAVAEFQRARSLDPTSPVIGAWLADGLHLMGRDAEAATEADRALEIDSTSVPVAGLAANVALARGQTQRARRLADVTWRTNGVPRPDPWPGTAAGIYAALGDTQTVRRIDRQVEASPLSRSFGHTTRAMVALALGDTARTLDDLEQATDAGEFWPSAPLISRRLDVVRGDARFAALLRRVNLDVALFTSPTGGRPR
jgi:eukaryotic-like serine/threonine-protein kinase